MAPIVSCRVRRAATLLTLVAMILGGGGTDAAPLIGSEEVAEHLRNLPAFDSFPDDYRQGLGGLPARVPDLVPLLVEVLSGKDLKAAAAAAQALGLLPARQEADALAKVLFDPPLPERKVFELVGDEGTRKVQGYSVDDAGLVLALRQAAAAALGRIGGATAVDALRRFFSESDLHPERLLYKETLVDPVTQRVLSNHELQDFIEPLLASVAQALAAADPVEAAEIFQKTIGSADERLRRNAARGLGLCARDEEARKRLLDFLQDKDTPASVVAEVLQSVARALSFSEMRMIIDTFSAKERCAPREFGLMVLDVATESELGRRPFQEDRELRELLAERLGDTCYNVAARAALLAHRLGLDGPLVKALSERDLRTIAEHFVFFILLGQEGSELVLIEALESDGGAAMSDAFMLCGNPQLLEAATAWREGSKRNARAEETAERSRSDLLFWGALGDAGRP